MVWRDFAWCGTGLLDSSLVHRGVVSSNVASFQDQLVIGVVVRYWN